MDIGEKKEKPKLPLLGLPVAIPVAQKGSPTVKDGLPVAVTQTGSPTVTMRLPVAFPMATLPGLKEMPMDKPKQPMVYKDLELYKETTLFVIDPQEDIVLTPEWHINVMTELKKYSARELEKASQQLKEDGFTGSMNGTHAEYLKNGLEQGWALSLLPPFPYLAMYLGNSSKDEAMKIITSLPNTTLATIYLQISGDPYAGSSRDELVNALVGYRRFIPESIALALPFSVFKTFVSRDGVPMVYTGRLSRVAPDGRTPIEAYRAYTEHFEKDGITIPTRYTIKSVRAPLRVLLPSSAKRRVPYEIPYHQRSSGVSIQVDTNDLAFQLFNHTFRKFAIGEFRPYVLPVGMRIFKNTPIQDEKHLDELFKNKKKGRVADIRSYLYQINGETLERFLAMIGWTGLTMDHDEIIQLLSLCYISNTDLETLTQFVNIRTFDLLRSIPLPIMKANEAVLTPDVLNDKVKLIWIIATWTKCPIKHINKKYYMERQNLQYSDLVTIIKCLYSPKFNTETYDTPARFLSDIPLNPLESLIMDYLNGQTTIIASFSLIKYDIWGTSDNTLFVEDFPLYVPCITRAFKPSTLVGFDYKNDEVLTSHLCTMTDMEIVEEFNLSEKFKSRDLLIKRAKALYPAYCRSEWTRATDKDTTINSKQNIMMMDKRVFDDDDDPAIGYGSILAPRRKRTYQLSEIVHSIKIENGLAIFHNPTYYSECGVSVHKNVAPDDKLKFFSIKMTTALRDFLPSLPQDNEYVMRLNEIFRDNFDHSRFGRYIVNVVQSVKLLNPEVYKIFVNSLVKLLKMSLYARFWKGPPHPYPYVWVEHGGDYADKDGLPMGIKITDYASQEVRDKNYVSAFYEFLHTFVDIDGFDSGVITKVHHQAIMDIYNSMFFLEYDVVSKLVYMTDAAMMPILLASIKSQMCLADLSNRGIKTAWMLLNYILNPQQLKELYAEEGMEEFVIEFFGVANHTDPYLPFKTLE